MVSLHGSSYFAGGTSSPSTSTSSIFIVNYLPNYDTILGCSTGLSSSRLSILSTGSSLSFLIEFPIHPAIDSTSIGIRGAAFRSRSPINFQYNQSIIQKLCNIHRSKVQAQCTNRSCRQLSHRPSALKPIITNHPSTIKTSNPRMSSHSRPLNLLTSSN